MENDVVNCVPKDDDSGSLKKTRYIGLEGSTTPCFLSPDSRGKLVQCLPSPSSAEKAKQLEKWISTPVKSTLKRFEKQMVSGTSKKLTKQGFLSSLLGTKNSKKDSSKLKIIRKKVALDTSSNQFKPDSKGWSRNEKQGRKPVRKRLDARSYRELFKKKAKLPDHILETMKTPSKAGGDAIRPNSSNEVEEREDGCCFSCSKRQRVDLESKRHRCFCNAGVIQEIHSNSPTKVCERLSMSRSPSTDPAILHDTGEVPPDAEVDYGREVETQLGRELPEEYIIDMQSNGSLIDTQSDREQAACVVCMKGGEILCCYGEQCKRGYHLSCLDPPLTNVPPGVWHCIWCVRKKIAMGVHSVSKKLESIWDARDAISNDEVFANDKLVNDIVALVNQRQKQYLVKYQGLAHIHNIWLPETELLIKAPDLVAKFNRKNEAVRWKTDWTVPNRLLQKRLLIFPKNDDESCTGYVDNNSYCHNEWLVKWTGLEYDHATWELDNASFLRSPEAMKLIRDYESRHRKAEQSSHVSKADEERKSPFNELSEFSFGGSSGVHDCCLGYVNKLREYWHKGQNAVVVDEQERIVKVILFILSLLDGVSRPFLIISTSTDISLWESKFYQMAPSANVIAYKGNRNNRGRIRTFEFYNEKGCLMFEVLLSSPEVVAEDFEFLECIVWEAIILDECQRSRNLRHLKQINTLSAYMRLLVVSGQLKGSSPEYVNLLSFLHLGFDGRSSHHLEIDSNANTSVLKERLAQFIAYECKLSFSRFVEYWVPVQLSSLQLEQYCATLLSNSMLLRSCLKNDTAGDLDDVLVSLRKCCDHPYLVDQSLQSSVTKGLPINTHLDVGIKFSGKLQLLDKMLLEIKSRSLRVLIIFQSLGGSGSYSVGDILDDFMYQRFGGDSYIRISAGAYVASKKQAALDMFNNQESGKFVLLIENRACLRSIKLSSVDTIILFDSDWDPRNDIKALERITIESQFEQLKVFRLYTSCTVEEKKLILAKEGVTLDSNIRNLSRSTFQRLFFWGASYLFKKLDDLHGCNTQISEEAFLNELLCEFSGQLPCNGENSNPLNCSKISKVEQEGGAYPTNNSLLGESHLVENNEPPAFFWTKLLEGRLPRWKLLSESSQRTRRKVQFFDASPIEPESKPDPVTKKCGNMVNTVDLVSLQPKLEDKRKLVAGDKEEEPADNNIATVPEVFNDKSKEERELHDAQRSTQLSLNPEISKLCQLLQFPEGVKGTALMFLELIMNDYDVGWDAASTLQAFQISLCWAAASFSKHKIDHKKSFALAKLHLNYDCKEKEARYIYFELRKLKNVYEQHKKNLKRLNKSHCIRALKPTKSDQQGMKGEMLKSSQSFTSLNQLVSSADEHGLEFRKKDDISYTIGQVLEICGKRLETLLEKQQKEVQEFNTMREKGKAKLEEEHRLESALIRTRYSEISVRLDKLNELDHNFKTRMDEQIFQMDICWQNLKASQLSSRMKEEQFKAEWMACLGDIKCGQSVSLGDRHLSSEELFDNFPTTQDDSSATSKYMPLPEHHTCDEVLQNVPSEVSVDEVTLGTSPQAAVTTSIVDDTENNRTEKTISEGATLNTELHRKSEESHKNCASILHSEIPTPETNVLTIQSAVQPSEVPEIVLNKVAEGDDPKKMETSAMQPTTECEERDAMNSEIATIMKSPQEQDSIAVNPTCGESHTSVNTGSGSSLVQLRACPTQGSKSPLHQLPLSTSPPSPVNNRANIHTSMGAQQNQSNVIISGQQAQVPRQTVIEDTAELFTTSVTHPLAYLPLPLPLSTDVHVDGSIQCVSDRRSLRIPESENDHSRPTSSNPLQNEMERILKDKEQAFKIHNETKLQLISECAKEMEDIRKKYDILLQDAETALVQKTKDLDTCFNKVFVNKLLAEALVHKDIKAAGSSAAHQAMVTSMNQFQLSFQHTAERGAFSQSSTNSMMIAPPVAPPVLVVSPSSAMVSAGPVGPHSSSMMRLRGDPFAGIGLRAPAPHLRPFRTSRPVSSSHLPPLPFGVPNQQP